jgi:hypothetical protein
MLNLIQITDQRDDEDGQFNNREQCIAQGDESSIRISRESSS